MNGMGSADIARSAQSLNEVELRSMSASTALHARQLPNMAMTESVMLNNPSQIPQRSPNRSPSYQVAPLRPPSPIRAPHRNQQGQHLQLRTAIPEPDSEQDAVVEAFAAARRQQATQQQPVAQMNAYEMLRQAAQQQPQTPHGYSGGAYPPESGMGYGYYEPPTPTGTSNYYVDGGLSYGSDDNYYYSGGADTYFDADPEFAAHAQMQYIGRLDGSSMAALEVW
jgi:hypothetical protein